MLASFAERMAARVSVEDQQTAPTPADPLSSGASEPVTSSEEHAKRQVLTEQMAVREPAARPSDGAGSESETAEYGPADLTLGRRGPETRTADHAASHPQRKRHKQSEHEASSPQASLGNSPPLAG